MQLVALVIFVLVVGSMVYWIKAVVAAFGKEESPAMGVLMVVFGVIFPPVAIILGWVNADKWDIRRTMGRWTAYAALPILAVVWVIMSGSN